jgi:hypothetical protein
MLFAQNASDHIDVSSSAAAQVHQGYLQFMITLLSATFIATTDVTAIHVGISDEAVLQAPALVQISS